MCPESSEGLNKETRETVYFFTTPFHPLDNFSAHTVKVWDVAFPTAEYAFQWKKFIVSEFQSFSLTIAKFFSMGITVIRHSTKGSLALMRDCVSAAEPPNLRNRLPININ